MSRYILLTVLVLFFCFCSKAQDSKAKEIVGLALKKHTSKKILSRYDVKVKYDRPGVTPTLYLQDPFAGKIDSVMATLSDSSKRQFQIRINKGKADIYQKNIKDNTAKQEIFRVDIPLKKMARIVVGYDRVIDSLGMVAWQDIYNQDYFFIKSLKLNPVALLQLMYQDSAQLRYVGISTIDNIDFHIVEVQVRDKWLSVYFNEQTYLLERMVEPKIDKDAYFGLDHYSEIVVYTNYKNHSGFLLPQTIEEINSKLTLSKIENVSWLSINKPFPVVSGK